MAKKKLSKTVSKQRSGNSKTRTASKISKIKIRKTTKLSAKTRPVTLRRSPFVKSQKLELIDENTKLKSPLSSRELKEYRQLLVHKRAEILGDMKSMSHDALNSDAANLSHMPLHMADVGSDNYEQELTLGLVESERKLLQEIDEAIDRIGAGTFGVCEATGKPIGKARLAAKPWAKHCIEYARQIERYGRR